MEVNFAAYKFNVMKKYMELSKNYKKVPQMEKF